MQTVAEIIHKAYNLGIAIPAFNIPYLPMLEPVVNAVIDADSFALIETARLEWIKFESKGPAFIAQEFAKWGKSDYVRLHLDHVPALDEDNLRVDYLPIFEEALALGYESVMIDGSRLPLSENIRVTQSVVELAHKMGVPVEAELGSVIGHESGPMPPYEELYMSGKGFTDKDEARQFAHSTACDWLSVAIGNVHGAIAAGRKDQKKVEARLNLTYLDQLNRALGIPLVLHGGSGIQQENVRLAMKKGIAKINIGTEIRQPYEVMWKTRGNISEAQEAVYERTKWVLQDFLGVAGTRKAVLER